MGMYNQVQGFPSKIFITFWCLLHFPFYLTQVYAHLVKDIYSRPIMCT